MMTLRRLKIFACLAVLCGFFAACHAHGATCTTLPANPSQSQIQSALNSCGNGNSVQGVAGTSSINTSSPLNIPCGVMLIGPTAKPATMVLNGGGGIGFIAETAGACSSSASTGISYVHFTNGGGFLIDSNNHANVVFTHNQTASIPDAATPCTSNCNNGANGTRGNGTTRTTFSLQISMGYPSTINGLLVEYNDFSDTNSCTNTIARAYVSDPSDGSGGPDGCGIEIFGQGTTPNIGIIVNGVFKYNTFTHMDEGIHFYGSNYTTGMLPINYCNGCDIEFNWFQQVRRITIEFQAQAVTNPLTISNNVFGPSGFGTFNSYYISTPCCQFGTKSNSTGAANPAYLEQNNIEYANGPDSTCQGQTVGCNGFQWGVEYWGNNSQSNFNLIQGFACTGYEVGYNGANGGPNVQYNTLQGPIMAAQANCYTYGNGHGQYMEPEFGQYFSSTITPNNESATPTSFVSVAPTISPASGAYSSPPTVTLTDPGYTAQSNYIPHGNTSIWYTTDGSTPVPGSGTAQIYTTPLVITLPATIKAVGMWGAANQPTSYPSGYGFTPSAVQTATYTGTGGITLSNVVLSTVGTITSLNVGQTVQVTATCTYSNGSTTNCSTTDAYGNAVSTWISSSTALTISNSGLVTAVSAGSASLSATVAGQTSRGYSITSVAPTISLTSISLATSGGISTLVAGAVNQLLATCTYSDNSNDNCTNADTHGNDANFNSTAQTVATVTSGGLVNAQSAGTTNLQAAVQFGATQSNWGQPLENKSGFTTPNFINAQYFVFGNQTGGYSPAGGTCSFYLPAGTLTVGSLYDCGLTPAPTPATQASAMQCWGTYTVTSATSPGAFVTVPLNSCGTTNLAAGSAWWVEVVTNQPGRPNAGFYNCGGSCTGAAPVSTGAGTYACGYVANTYGTRSGMATAINVGGCGPGNVQAAQYVTLGQPPLLSNTVLLTVTAAAPVLESVAVTATGSPSSLTLGSRLQFVAMCTYSNAQVTNCSVADIYGNAVSGWSSSNTAVVTVGAAGTGTAGLATAVAAGSANVQAMVGTLASPAYALTVTNPAVTLTAISLATADGVNGLFVGYSNLLIATCVYSDESTTLCSTPDSYGNVASNYVSSSPAAATVNSSGLVTGVAPGMTSLQAQAGGFSSNAIPLTVLAVPTGTYAITISGPVSFSGTVRF